MRDGWGSGNAQARGFVDPAWGARRGGWTRLRRVVRARGGSAAGGTGPAEGASPPLMGAVCCGGGAEERGGDENEAGVDGKEGVGVEGGEARRKYALPAGYIGNNPDPESPPPPPRFGGRPSRKMDGPSGGAGPAIPRSPKEGAHEMVGRKRRKRNGEGGGIGPLHSPGASEAQAAAIKLQAATRGHLARVEVARMRAARAEGPAADEAVRVLHETVGNMSDSVSLVQGWWAAMRLGQRPKAPEGLTESLAMLDANGEGQLCRTNLHDSLTLLGDMPLDDDAADALVAAIFDTRAEGGAPRSDAPSLPISALVALMAPGDDSSVWIALEGETLTDCASLCRCSAEHLGEHSGFSRAQASADGLHEPLPAGTILVLPPPRPADSATWKKILRIRPPH